MTLVELGDWVVANVEALREAGITQFKLGECEFIISPKFEMPKHEPSEPELSPLDDPNTFGRGGRVPGYPRRSEGI